VITRFDGDRESLKIALGWVDGRRAGPREIVQGLDTDWALLLRYSLYRMLGYYPSGFSL